VSKTRNKPVKIPQQTSQNPQHPAKNQPVVAIFAANLLWVH